MIGDIDFQRLDLMPYEQAISSILGQDSGFGLIRIKDETPCLIWESGQSSLIASLIVDGDQRFGASTELNLDKMTAWLKNQCLPSFDLLIEELELDLWDNQFYFWGLTPANTESNIDLNTISHFFSHIAQCLEVYINLHIENDGMALELARHYEELNLIYQIEKHSKELAETSESLNRVVENMSNFMDVDAAFLIIPDMEQWIFHATQGSGLFENEAGIKKMARVGLMEIKQDLKTIVLNRKQLKTPKYRRMKEPFLMILSPIQNSDKKLIGAIGCVRKPNACEFETGDRKLVDALSQRAGKIVLMDLDPMTGLNTRSNYENKLKDVLTQPARKNNHAVACLINIDQFRLINDAYGVTVADEILKQVSQLLRSHIRNRDCISRLEGDKFALILQGMRSVNDGWNILERIRTDIAEKTFKVADNIIHITVRIGYVILADPVNDVAQVNATVEIATEEAREKGGNCIKLYEKGGGRLKEKMNQTRYATQIEKLVEQGRFVLFSQPIIPLHGDRMYYEILIRLLDDNQKIIPPFRFLPAAEAYKKMPFIDRWVIENTCQCLEENASTLHHFDISWGINLSGQSLQDETFINFFLFFLSKLSIPTSWVHFEITETVAIRSFSKVIEVIEQVKQMGFAISLDDFGTGYSSFEYLQQLPVSHLKIDGSFIKDLETNKFNQVAVQSIVEIAKFLEIKTIAEFVENQNILDFLKKLKVNYAQGYHTGKPMALADTLKQIEKHQRQGSWDLNQKD